MSLLCKFLGHKMSKLMFGGKSGYYYCKRCGEERRPLNISWPPPPKQQTTDRGDYGPIIIIATFSKKYLPERKYTSTGWDCKARLSVPKINELQRAKVPLGFKLMMPNDCYADIRPRSGLAFKEGITILNSPGLIDPDYRGEVSAIIINLSKAGTKINVGQSICQITFNKRYRIKRIINKDIYDNFENLYPTKRGIEGFGSSGR